MFTKSESRDFNLEALLSCITFFFTALSTLTKSCFKFFSVGFFLIKSTASLRVFFIFRFMADFFLSALSLRIAPVVCGMEPYNITDARSFQKQHRTSFSSSDKYIIGCIRHNGDLRHVPSYGFGKNPAAD